MNASRTFRSLSMAAALLVSGTAAFAQSDWKIDPVHSDVTFTITHLGVSKVQGTFNKVSGDVMVDDANPSKDGVNATIEVKSLSTGNTTRDGHILGDGFWQSDKFPAITFKSTGAEKVGSGLNVKGDLTMHGVTKPVTLKVTDMSKAMDNPMHKGAQVRGFSATTELNRKDFGMVWTGQMAMADGAVGDTLSITLNIEADK